MWRALFLALGISAVILGAESLTLEKAVLKPKGGKQQSGFATASWMSPTARGKEVVPPEWAPWSLLSIGAVTMLYSFTIPQRVGSKG
ncbi:MAG: hypothetical protein K1X74_02420 [Pirellulales bacterium]|nr:hypothetical protein [Pirellulales bacterium]